MEMLEIFGSYTFKTKKPSMIFRNYQHKQCTGNNVPIYDFLIKINYTGVSVENKKIVKYGFFLFVNVFIATVLFIPICLVEF